MRVECVHEELIKIEELRPHPKNPNTHPARQIEVLAKIIKATGWRSPVVVSKRSGFIVKGHGRLLAAKQAGFTEVPVDRQYYASDEEELADMVADNEIAELAEMDMDLRSELLAELEAQDYPMDLVRFEEELATEEPFEGLVDEDALPEDVPPVVQLGEVWQLGKHRLICGDSTKGETVAKLLETDSDKPTLILTDPPYGMSYGGGRARGDDSKFKNRSGGIKAHGEIIGDDLRGDSLVDLVRESLSAALGHLAAGVAAYVCLTWRTYSEFIEAFDAAGLELSGCIVWNKKSIGLGHGHYRPQHEFIFYHKGEKWLGGKGESDVWECSRGSTGDYVHPTQKPVEILERAILNSSERDELVLDSFGGSGSTIIACQKQHRQARVVELDPKYCDAIIARWELFSGEKAELMQGAS